MAYEIVIARCLPGESWGRTLERIEQSADMTPPRMSAERAQAWERTVERIGAEETDRHRVNRVELTLDRPPVGVILEEHAAFVSISHRPGADDATTTMAQVAEVVGIICDESGWGAWDQQLNRELDLPGDLLTEGAAVLATGGMAAGTAADETGRADDAAATTDHAAPPTDHAAAAADEPSSGRWWRFWSR